MDLKTHSYSRSGFTDWGIEDCRTENECISYSFNSFTYRDKWLVKTSPYPIGVELCHLILSRWKEAITNFAKLERSWTPPWPPAQRHEPHPLESILPQQVHSFLNNSSSGDTSADKKTRDKAVKNLAAFLSDPDRPHISNHEMDKLWKGIFYCELSLKK